MSRANIMGNQQEYILSKNQKQVLLTGTFGDGNIVKTKSGNWYYQTNSIHREYLYYKGNLLGNLYSGSVRTSLNRGFKEAEIHTIHTKHSSLITDLHSLDIETKINQLNDLGIALWFYDDGSLHKKNHFFNLNTQSFSREIQEDVIIPFLKNFNIYGKCLVERKKDGKEFYYIYISRASGSFEISSILQKYRVPCFDYKMWSSETILKWSKVQMYLKSQGRIITPRLIGDYMNKDIIL